MIGERIKAWLAHPLTRDLELDDPRTTQLRRQIIQEKRCLRQIYQEWYTAIVQALPAGDDPVLEVGSGAGFLRDLVPGLLTSEMFSCPGISTVLNASQLPFRDGTLRGIVMTDVLHHMPQARHFFAEMTRCVRPGGVVVMIEPWVSLWSKFIYRRFHHEPFWPEATAWEFPPSGPLSGANGALPWMIFARDRAQFEQEFPAWHIRAIKLGLPFRYLVSGGVSLRNLVPAATLHFLRWLEHRLQPWMRTWAMFAEIILVRLDDKGRGQHP